jgi:hypothetical protein
VVFPSRSRQIPECCFHWAEVPCLLISSIHHRTLYRVHVTASLNRQQKGEEKAALTLREDMLNAGQVALYCG